MTTNETSLTTRAELNADLRSLLLRAYDNGIDVEGGWECRNGAEHPDWDVIVTEVEKNERSENEAVESASSVDVYRLLR